jgi:hypothetical protein
MRFLDEIPRFPIDRNSKISEIPKPKLDSESGPIFPLVWKNRTPADSYDQIQIGDWPIYQKRPSSWWKDRIFLFPTGKLAIGQFTTKKDTRFFWTSPHLVNLVVGVRMRPPNERFRCAENRRIHLRLLKAPRVEVYISIRPGRVPCPLWARWNIHFSAFHSTWKESSKGKFEKYNNPNNNTMNTAESGARCSVK